MELMQPRMSDILQNNLILNQPQYSNSQTKIKRLDLRFQVYLMKMF